MARARLSLDSLEGSLDDLAGLPAHEARRRLRAVWDIVDLYWPNAPARTKDVLHEIEETIRPGIVVAGPLRGLPH